MSLLPQRTRVKICGLTRLEDVQTVVSAGADALGLVFYPPSPRFVSVEQASLLAAQVPAFVTVTALFVNPQPDEVENVLDNVNIDLIQFHGDESEAFCAQFGRPYIKAIRVKDDTDLVSEAERYHSAKALLLDTYKTGVPGGTGEVFNWDLIPKNLNKPVILAGGLTVDNIAAAIDTVAPYAVDVSGGVESSKGVKNKDLIEKLMKEVSCAITS